MVRRSLDEILASQPNLDHEKLRATTEDDIRRYMIEDGEDPDAELPSAWELVVPPQVVREKLGMTQEEFAKALRVPLGTLRNWEQRRVGLDPAAVIKVMRPEVLARHRSGGAWYKRYRRDRPFKIFLREVREHLALRAAEGPSIPFLATIIGFVETDLGLGLVTEAVRGRDGDYARSLRRLIEEGAFDQDAARALDAFAAAILVSDVIVSDLNPDNLLYAYDAASGGRFVLADGFGERAIVPVKGAVPRLKRRRKLRQIRGLAAEIGRPIEVSASR